MVNPIAASLIAIAAMGTDRVAVIDAESEYTYGELLERAGGVATRLAADDGTAPIVVLTSYSRHSVAASFGALLAGRGVVPLDPNQPRARLVELIERASPAAVVDATGTVTGTVGRYVVIDAVSLAPTSFEPRAADPSTTSSVFFTSGSTGVPKGVRHTYAEAITALDRWRRAQQIELSERAAVFMPPNFAGGYVGAVFGSASGRTAALLDPRAHDSQRLMDMLDRYELNRGTMTPSLARALAEASNGRRLETMNLVNLTGEALEWADVAMVRQVLPVESRIRMAYGASETLGLVCVTYVEPDAPVGVGRVPLGRPEPDLDYRFENVDPETGRGELVVRRHVVAGYLDDPVLTAERFGHDPDGVRFWRSGDLIRVDSDGVMHHCGRSDDMIKSNGRLVEPAEVERALSSVPGVRRSVVLPRLLGSGRTQVVGHLEVDDSATPEGVRGALRELLPEYLVPSVFVRHERIPVTDRGKVDRQALRTSLVVPWKSTERSGPVDAFVVAVSAVVKNVLGLQHLDPDDVLWDVGCDSLSAIEIVAALLDIHPGRLEPNDLLTAPTARELAHRLSSGTARRPSHVVTMHPSGTRPPLFLVAGGGSPAISYRSMVSALGPDQPVVIFEQIGMHDDAPPVSDIRETARVNVEILRRIDPVGPYVVAGHSWGGLVAQRMAADLAASGAEVRLVLLDTARPSRRSALDAPVYRPRPAGMPDWLRRVEIALTDLTRFARRVVPARPGSERYYEQFWGRAIRSARGYRPPPSSVPTVLLQPERSTADQSWNGHGEIAVVTVGGNHRTMVHREHIESALDHLRP
jgi:acyl-CoA synthetase (AMP-forming)/AMP-acid ligase II/thioesterase domain-containing protein